jgi:hypothetical protein
MAKTPEPVTCADLGIEAVTQFRAASDPFTSREPRCNGGNARLIPISLPRVRWLDRPVVGGEWSDEDE